MTRAILAPLDAPADESKCGLASIPVALSLAALEGASLRVLHVLPPSTKPFAMADLVQRLGLDPDELRTCSCILDQRHGDAAEEIVRAAREQHALAIVLCTHAGHPSLAGDLGRTARHVLENAPCPVILVRPSRGRAPWRVRHVLLPHDGTPRTTEAMGRAADLAGRSIARLSVMHVAATHPGPAREPGAFQAPQYVDQRQHEWPAWASEFVERVTSASPLNPSQLRLVLGAGDPAREVLRYARENEVDLIVVAWAGTLDGEHAAVVRAVLLEAPCPVMVLKTDRHREHQE